MFNLSESSVLHVKRHIPIALPFSYIDVKNQRLIEKNENYETESDKITKNSMENSVNEEIDKILVVLMRLRFKYLRFKNEFQL